jgi:predicted HD superfamily hydrolase involved in NAD metabolism
MHDVCKDMDPKEQLQLFEQFDIMLDNIEKNAPKLWHAILGAAYLERALGISDKEILNAVRYHTTARANMGLLEKLIYLADFTSEDRDYNGVDSMRKAVDVSLEKAMFEALEFSVEDLKAKGCPVHKDTMDAYLEVKE